MIEMFEGSLMAADVNKQELTGWFWGESCLARKLSFVIRIHDDTDGQQRQTRTVEVEKNEMMVTSEFSYRV